jgi:Zn-dependent peptidase ImmA (M78 family)
MNTIAAPLPFQQTPTKLQIPWSPPVEPEGMKSKVKKQAERDAQRLFLTRLTENFAVDPVAIADRLGVRVSEPELDQDILSAFFMKPGGDPRLLVNRRHSLLRRRYCCALELGHYLWMSARVSEYKRLDLSEGVEEMGGESNDEYARHFASSLLMPRDFVGLFVDLGMDDLEMALKLFVPREEMRTRLLDLDSRRARAAAA